MVNVKVLVIVYYIPVGSYNNMKKCAKAINARKLKITYKTLENSKVKENSFFLLIWKMLKLD